MLNILLFGPPGCGKGTQAEKLTAKYSLKHLSTGDVLRAEKESGSDLGNRMAKLMEAGLLVPDEIVNEIVQNRIQEFSSKVPGFIFDGFPRTNMQAKALDGYLNDVGSSVTVTLFLDVPQDELVKRLLKRSIEKGRLDDTVEVIKARLVEYENQTLPVAEFYRKQGKLFQVNGLGTEEEIFGRLTAIVDRVRATV
jgi:adenylate kinase